jgi:hypothetical protein
MWQSNLIFYWKDNYIELIYKKKKNKIKNPYVSCKDLIINIEGCYFHLKKNYPLLSNHSL